MSTAAGLHPTFSDYIWDVLEVNVKKTDGVNSNLREYMCLRGCCEEKQDWRVWNEVLLFKAACERAQGRGM